MATDEQHPAGSDEHRDDAPTVVVDAPVAGQTAEVTGEHEDELLTASAAIAEPGGASEITGQKADGQAHDDAASDGKDARQHVDEAIAKVVASKDRVAGKASDGRERLSGKAAESKERLADKADSVRERAESVKERASERAASLASSARERAAGTDVKELAASTTSLIDTARPFFLAFFALLFTALGFIEGDAGTSQLFVVGAILFVLAAGFSDELGRLVPGRRSAPRD